MKNRFVKQIPFSGFSGYGGGLALLNLLNVPEGQQAYTTPGTYSWTAPAGVTKVSVVCVGGGGGAAPYSGNGGIGAYGSGGGGGGLGWKNNITVVPGQSYTVVVGDGGSEGTSPTAGGDSYFINTSTVKGGGGDFGSSSTTSTGGSYTGDGGGNGGNGAYADAGGGSYGGGGGAGGYTGNGGSAATSGGSHGDGSGGGGGGGFSSGGGVGIYGQGANGTGGFSGGTGGSGGTKGQEYTYGSDGGFHGGGGGCSNNSSGFNGGDGGVGAVRIIWGSNRSFPSTNTGNTAGNASVFFDGHNDHLNITGQSDLAFGNNNFTLECWIYLASVDGTLDTVMESRSSTGSSDGFLIGRFHTSGYENKLALFTNGNYQIVSDSTISDNTWVHVAAVRSGSTTKLYIDGVAQSTTYNDNNNYSNDDLIIGENVSNSYQIHGFISNFRMVKGTAVYTSNFTVPTEPLTNVTNTKLLCCQSDVSPTTFVVSPGTINANGSITAHSTNPFS